MGNNNEAFNEIKVDCIFEHGDMDDDRKAILVTDGGAGENAKWIPKSQIKEHERNQFDEGYIVIPQWLAEKTGFV